MNEHLSMRLPTWERIARSSSPVIEVVGGGPPEPGATVRIEADPALLGTVVVSDGRYSKLMPGRLDVEITEVLSR